MWADCVLSIGISIMSQERLWKRLPTRCGRQMAVLFCGRSWRGDCPSVWSQSVRAGDKDFTSVGKSSVFLNAGRRKPSEGEEDGTDRQSTAAHRQWMMVNWNGHGILTKKAVKLCFLFRWFFRWRVRCGSAADAFRVRPSSGSSAAGGQQTTCDSATM